MIFCLLFYHIFVGALACENLFSRRHVYARGQGKARYLDPFSSPAVP